MIWKSLSYLYSLARGRNEFIERTLISTILRLFWNTALSKKPIKQTNTVISSGFFFFFFFFFFCFSHVPVNIFFGFLILLKIQREENLTCIFSLLFYDISTHVGYLMPNPEPDMQDTAGEAGTSSYVMYSYGPPHMAGQKQDDQHERTFSSYVRIRDVALKTCQRRWTIGRSGERESGISVLAARHDDDDDDDIYLCVRVCVCVL